MEIQLYKEALLFQKVGVGGLPGAGGQAGAGCSVLSRWQHVAPRWAFHFLPLTNASLQPPLVPLSLQVIFTTGQKKKSGDISSRSPLKPLHQLPRKTSWQMALVLGAQRSNKSPELPASHRNAFFRKLRRLGVQAPTPVSDVTLRR